MFLTIDSYASYLVKPQARSRVAGYFQLNSNNKSLNFANWAILIEYKTLHNDVASSTESETAGISHDVQVAIPLRYMITEMGHPQPSTLLKTDNTTANLSFRDNITEK